jgi:hypothetical protein
VEKSELLVEVNSRIRAVAWRSGHGSAPVWGFVCECGDPGCSDRVHLPLDAFDRLRAASEAVLAAGHIRVRARAAQAEAAGLREESQALRNQARHQIRRASVLAASRSTSIEAVCASCGYGICASELPTACPLCRSAGWLFNTPA